MNACKQLTTNRHMMHKQHNAIMGLTQPKNNVGCYSLKSVKPTNPWLRKTLNHWFI